MGAAPDALDEATSETTGVVKHCVLLWRKREGIRAERVSR
jgi:hypothetical protein